MLWSVFDGHQRRTTPLAPDPKALCEAQHDEQNRCPDANGGVAGQQPHQHRRRAHEQQRVDQHRLAADLVAVVGEDGAAEGPRDEPDGERSESGQGAGYRIKDGKKTWLKTRAAAVPKMKKSYHSIVVPMRLAKATLRDEWRDGPSVDRCEVSRWFPCSEYLAPELSYRCAGPTP